MVEVAEEAEVEMDSRREGRALGRPITSVLAARRSPCRSHSSLPGFGWMNSDASSALQGARAWKMVRRVGTGRWRSMGVEQSFRPPSMPAAARLSAAAVRPGAVGGDLHTEVANRCRARDRLAAEEWDSGCAPVDGECGALGWVELHAPAGAPALQHHESCRHVGGKAREYSEGSSEQRTCMVAHHDADAFLLQVVNEVIDEEAKHAAAGRGRSLDARPLIGRSFGADLVARWCGCKP